MEVTNAHARQAFPLSLMEKPVIMVRFKRGRGGGGVGEEAVLRKRWRGMGEGSTKHMSYTLGS